MTVIINQSETHSIKTHKDQHSSFKGNHMSSEPSPILDIFMTFLISAFFENEWILNNKEYRLTVFLASVLCSVIIFIFKLVVFSVLLGFCLIWYHGGFILVKLFYPSFVVIFSGIIPNLEFLMSIYCHIILDAFSCGSHLVPSFFHMYTHTIFIWV